MSFAFIAPYADLRNEAQKIIEAEGLPGKAYLGKGAAGVTAAREALRKGARILVSRGGTGSHIASTLGIEVIEVKGSLPYVAAFLYRETTPETRIAIAGSSRIIELARPLCRALGRIHAGFAVENLGEVQPVFEKVMAWKPDALIGDAEMARRHLPEGMAVHLVESTTETLREAFMQAMLVLANTRRQYRNEKNLSAVLDCVQEGAMLVNDKGVIEEINATGCKLLHTDRENAIGRYYQSLIPADEIHSVMKNRKSMRNTLASFGGRRFVCNLSMVNIEPELDSAVFLFQEIEQIQKTEVSTRKKLYQKGLFARYSFDDIIHESAVMRKVVATAREYAETDCNILIQGESGTGKELFAQSIHNASHLSHGPFVAINCAALPANLLESELFGYTPGAFTGALPEGKAGLFELAHRGTLFLDEIGEMDVQLQSRLLRAIQEREIRRLGDDQVIPVRVRIIAAANKPLNEAIAAGKFRDDLYFRLNVLDLHIPPLRERGNDAAILFLELLSRRTETGRNLRRPTAAFLENLKRAAWPGNIRQLENLVEKFVALKGEMEFEPENAAPPAFSAHADGGNMDAIIARNVRDALAREDGNISRAAARLGLSRNTVKRWRDWRGKL